MNHIYNYHKCFMDVNRLNTPLISSVCEHSDSANRRTSRNSHFPSNEKNVLQEQSFCVSVSQSANLIATWSVVCQKCQKFLIYHLRRQRRVSDTRQDVLCVSCCPAWSLFPLFADWQATNQLFSSARLNCLDDLWMKDYWWRILEVFKYLYAYYYYYYYY